MMTDPGTPTFDQLKVFLTVVDVGSFAGAALVMAAISASEYSRTIEASVVTASASGGNLAIHSARTSRLISRAKSSG